MVVRVAYDHDWQKNQALGNVEVSSDVREGDAGTREAYCKAASRTGARRLATRVGLGDSAGLSNISGSSRFNRTLVLSPR
jgi:hypothetical protein